MSNLTIDEIKAKVASRKFWYHRIEVAPGIMTPGINDCASTLDLLALPRDMTGLRVLDIGAAEGFFAYECERRGAAEVLAVDYNSADHTGFALVSELLSSRIRHRVDTIYTMRADDYGLFDVILFLGILYHLPDPMLTLRIVRNLCKPAALMFLETHISDHMLLTPEGQPLEISESLREQLKRVPLMQFYAGNSLNRDDCTNFWGPNMTCLRHMLLDSNFEILSEVENPRIGNRGIFNCRAAPEAPRDHLIRQAYGAWWSSA